MAQLGRYTILEAIGEGGMAEVWKARLEGPMGFQKTVAIKRIREATSKDKGEFIHALINEARIGGRLKHPNIVEVHELAEHEGAYYIVMEHIDGVAMDDLLDTARAKKERLPPNVVLDIAIQVCRGLGYAHRFTDEGGAPLHLVHRDLKPSNIMVTLDGVAKVMDFGIAKASSNLFNTTDPGIAKGTPLYMSPEQLRGMRPLPPASDLFSFGAILYEMATGKILFRGRTMPEIISRVLNFPLDDAFARVEAAIPGLGSVISKLLDRDPKKRPADTDLIVKELERIADWQDQRTTTKGLIRDFRSGTAVFEAAIRDAAAEDEPPPEPESEATPGSQTLHEATAANPLEKTWIRSNRRWRYGLLLLVPLAAVVGAGVTRYVWRGTVGAQQQLDEAESALRSGDLVGAHGRWSAALAERPSSLEARFSASALGAWASEPRDDGLRRLEHAPEETAQEFAKKYEAFSWVLRRAGDYEGSFRYLKVGMEKLADARAAGLVAPAETSLIWEAAESAVVISSQGDRSTILGVQDAGRGLWSELRDRESPGPLHDRARAWVEALDRGREGLLRAEILWIDGFSDRAFTELAAAWGKAVGPKEDLVGERMVWMHRALSEGRWADSLALIEAMAAPGKESELAWTLQVARASTFAGLGKTDLARKELTASLKSALSAEGRAKARLLVARSLLRANLDAAWTSGLIDEAASELANPADPDVAWLRSGMPESSGPFAPALRRMADPRTGRLYAMGLRRGGPTSSHLVPPEDFARVNRSERGSAWPFGPTFHPVDRSPLAVLYSPLR